MQKVNFVILVSGLVALSVTGCCPRCHSSSVCRRSIEPSFNPQEFLCRFSGGMVREGRDPSAGRRYTLEERARARAEIATELRRFGLVSREQSFSVCSGDTRVGCLEGVNLMASLPSDIGGDEVVIVGAHYDTAETSPGADDNASGVTAVLMVAEAMSHRSQRSVNILFVFFDEEEEGLLGSFAFVRSLSLIPEQNIVAVHILDMIGFDGDEDRVVELEHCYDSLEPHYDSLEEYPAVVANRAIYQHAAERLAVQGGLIPGALLVNESCRSDHVPFSGVGIRAVHIGEEFSSDDISPNYHQSTDTCNTLDFTFLRMVANLVTEVVSLER